MLHEGGKLDWLRERPDKRLQTPEGQAFLGTLQQHVNANPKIDGLTPWLAREWKKGRVQHDQTFSPQDYGQTLSYHAQDAIPRPLGAPQLSHWADWFQSKHPTRQGVDIMQFGTPDMHSRIVAWDQMMLEEAENAKQGEASKGGERVHEWPDGWSIRKLAPEHLDYEGENMGHCVGGYGYDEQVRDGHTMIYSLRGPDHRPHATMEFTPSHYELNNEGKAIGRDPKDWRPALPPHGELDGPHYQYRDQTKPVPNNAEIVQIQGKGNKVPIPEYQARIKDWFSTFPKNELPQWGSSPEISHIRHLDPDAIVANPRDEPADHEDDGGYGEHGDYGLPDGRTVDWEELLGSLTRYQGGRGYGSEYLPSEGEMIYDLARRRGEIPQFAEGLEKFQEKQQENFDDWRSQNYEHTVPYPADADEDSDEMKEYFDDEQQWAEEHTGMSAVNHLYPMLSPHWDPRTQKYENEPFLKPTP